MKKLLTDPSKPWIVVLNWLIVSILLVLFFWISLSRIQVTFDFSFISKYRIRIIDGFILTIVIALSAFVLSLIFGILGALGQMSKVLIFQYFSKLYVSFIRGTPLIMQIYLFYYIVGTAWGVNNRLFAGILILSVFEGAYICEIIRGAYASLDQSQLLAASAVGFDHFQTLRFVIIPQMVARTLPALAGQIASMIKDSSLLSLISVIELTQTIREISAGTLKLFESYLFLGVLYLCLTLPITAFSKWLERKFTYGNQN